MLDLLPLLMWSVWLSLHKKHRKLLKTLSWPKVVPYEVAMRTTQKQQSTVTFNFIITKSKS